MIFAASCMLNGSPAPIPGAPLKSPIVSVAVPFEFTEPGPVGRLIRLNTLYISARSCTLNRSVTEIFLKFRSELLAQNAFLFTSLDYVICQQQNKGGKPAPFATARAVPAIPSSMPV